MNPPSRHRPTVVIAGATGFVGKALVEALSSQYRVIGLTRKVPTGPTSTSNSVEWRKCDLFSLQDAEAAIRGADFVFYLVHSMMPSAKLTQGHFSDMDLIAADNFARAAQRAEVKQIIYLGGLVPRNIELSQHLASRLEVEQTLQASGRPVTALRAGMIIGAGGSSFLMMTRLVRRLPVMICPSWSLNLTSPIALSDVIRYLTFCLDNALTLNQTFDIASTDTLSYRTMLQLTAEHLGLQRRLLPFPFFTRKLSRLWVSLITGAPKELVNPLIGSLKSPMIATDLRLRELMQTPPLTFRQALDEAFSHSGRVSKPVAFSKAREEEGKHTVRSVQRLPFPLGASVDWTAREYLAWLPRWIPLIIRVQSDATGHCAFYLKLLRLKLLTLYLNQDHSHAELRVFEIGEGALVQPGHQGRLEFRRALGQNSVLSAIHEYYPRLPWFVYVLTQAKIHLWVMRAFGKHLGRFKPAPKEVAA